MRKRKKAEPAPKPNKRRRKYHHASRMIVFDWNTVYFNDYLVEYIGSNWQGIKTSLYDAGYKTPEVSQYREDRIAEFKQLCRDYCFYGII